MITPKAPVISGDDNKTAGLFSKNLVALANVSLGGASTLLSFFGQPQIPQQNAVDLGSTIQLLRNYGLSSNSPVIPVQINKTQGPPGTVITLTGASFLDVTSATIGNTPLIISSKTSSSMVVFVMPGSVTGIITAVSPLATYQTPIFTVTQTFYPTSQFGPFLTSNTTGAQEGTNVGISADGQTIFSGGYVSNFGTGWFWTLVGGAWTMQGAPIYLQGSMATQPSPSGAFSPDGNTALIGGYGPSGEARFFQRTGQIWSQLGPTILPQTATSNPGFGHSVSISADGNTAVVSAPNDATFGDCFVYNFVNGQWTPNIQGPLVPNNPTGSYSYNAWIVGISSDGLTIVTGAPYDGTELGAVWIWNLNTVTGIWTQTAKLVPNDTYVYPYFGWTVAINADGTTLVVGAPYDQILGQEIGTVWVYVLVSGTWLLQQKFYIADNSIYYLGTGVAVSADGNVIAVSGQLSTTNGNRVFIYTRTNGVWSQQVALADTPDVSNAGLVCMTPDATTLVCGGPTANSNKGGFFVFT